MQCELPMLSDWATSTGSKAFSLGAWLQAGEGAGEWEGALQDMLGMWGLEVRGPFGDWTYDACSTTGIGEAPTSYQ